MIDDNQHCPCCKARRDTGSKVSNFKCVDCVAHEAIRLRTNGTLQRGYLKQVCCLEGAPSMDEIVKRISEIGGGNGGKA